MLEPRYLLSLPKEIIQETGFDAVSHAIETYVSLAASIFTKSMSFAALRRIIPPLIQLSTNNTTKDLTDEQRSDLLCGSCISRYEFGKFKYMLAT